MVHGAAEGRCRLGIGRCPDYRAVVAGRGDLRAGAGDPVQRRTGGVPGPGLRRRPRRCAPRSRPSCKPKHGRATFSGGPPRRIRSVHHIRARIAQVTRPPPCSRSPSEEAATLLGLARAGGSSRLLCCGPTSAGPGSSGARRRTRSFVALSRRPKRKESPPARRNSPRRNPRTHRSLSRKSGRSGRARSPAYSTIDSGGSSWSCSGQAQAILGAASHEGVGTGAHERDRLVPGVPPGGQPIVRKSSRNS